MKQYKDIPGYEGLYQISEDGEVMSMERKVFHWRGGLRSQKQSIKHQRIDKDGYPVLMLSKDGKKTHFGIHRLVALAWIPNPDNLPQVNHIDGVKTNSHRSNLEWCTVSHNILHSFRTLNKKCPWTGVGSQKGRFGKDHNQAKAVVQLTLDGFFIRQFDAMVDAKEFGFQPSHIINCAKGKTPHHRGFKWMYAKDYTSLKAIYI